MMPLAPARGPERAKCQVPLASAICVVRMVIFDMVNSNGAPPAGARWTGLADRSRFRHLGHASQWVKKGAAFRASRLGPH